MTTTSQPIFATLFAILRRQGKFSYLLIAQVVLIALFLYLDRPGVPTIVFRSLAVMAFVVGVYAVSERHSKRMTAMALAILAAVPYIIVTLRPNALLWACTSVRTHFPGIQPGVLAGCCPSRQWK